MTIYSYDDLREVITNCLGDRLTALGLVETGLDDSVDLLETGIVDSFGFLDLLDAIETHTGIQVDLMAMAQDEPLTIRHLIDNALSEQKVDSPEP